MAAVPMLSEAAKAELGSAARRIQGGDSGRGAAHRARAMAVAKHFPVGGKCPRGLAAEVREAAGVVALNPDGTPKVDKEGKPVTSSQTFLEVAHLGYVLSKVADAKVDPLDQGAGRIGGLAVSAAGKLAYDLKKLLGVDGFQKIVDVSVGLTSQDGGPVSERAFWDALVAARASAKAKAKAKAGSKAEDGGKSDPDSGGVKSDADKAKDLAGSVVAQLTWLKRHPSEVTPVLHAQLMKAFADFSG